MEAKFEIVRRVDGLFALADQLEARLAKSPGQVEKLTPSLLARAFADQLVPQDPTDEPAEKLLKRIKEEKMPAAKNLRSALRRLQNRFATVMMDAALERLRGRGIKPKLVRQKDHVSLRIYREQNHRLPHFHIEFKKQYAASYAISSGEKLAGNLPAKYEKTMLPWARDNSSLLLAEWSSLNAGEVIQLTSEGGRN